MVGVSALSPQEIARIDADLRADGKLPRLGRPKKHGPREANGRVSRRKADIAASPEWSEVPDRLWQDIVLKDRCGGLPVDPLFLNLARRGDLTINSFMIALLWWSTRDRLSHDGFLLWQASKKTGINFETEVEFVESEERRAAVAERLKGIHDREERRWFRITERTTVPNSATRRVKLLKPSSGAILSPGWTLRFLTA